MEWLAILIILAVTVLVFIILMLPIVGLVFLIIFLNKKNKCRKLRKKTEVWKKKNDFVEDSRFSISLCKNKIEAFCDDQHEILLIVDYKNYKDYVLSYSEIEKVKRIYKHKYPDLPQPSPQRRDVSPATMAYMVRKQYGLGPGIAFGLLDKKISSARDFFMNVPTEKLVRMLGYKERKENGNEC